MPHICAVRLSGDGYVQRRHHIRVIHLQIGTNRMCHPVAVSCYVNRIKFLVYRVHSTHVCCRIIFMKFNISLVLFVLDRFRYACEGVAEIHKTPSPSCKPFPYTCGKILNIETFSVITIK